MNINKMIREDLKAAFPGTKFSVGKNGYDCVTIKWINGPASYAVMMAVGIKYSVGDSRDYRQDLGERRVVGIVVRLEAA